MGLVNQHLIDALARAKRANDRTSYRAYREEIKRSQDECPHPKAFREYVGPIGSDPDDMKVEMLCRRCSLVWVGEDNLED